MFMHEPAHTEASTNPSINESFITFVISTLINASVSASGIVEVPFDLNLKFKLIIYLIPFEK